MGAAAPAADPGGRPGGADALRRRLNEQLAHTLDEMEGRRRAATPGGERPGFGKRAGDYVAQVVDDRTNNQVADSLAATAAAIERSITLLDEGRYGRCIDCGEAIGPERLEAVPWAERCVRCAAAATPSSRPAVVSGRRRG
jgi:RNA polymerase-binding transcription factor DksA